MVKIFLDGADLALIRELESQVDGFTTNPSLMKTTTITNYKAWASLVIDASNHKPVSFEVVSDDFEIMESQAREIASWGDNVYVKIPACLTSGKSSGSLIRCLSHEGIKVNVTAVMTLDQINTLTRCLRAPAIFSIFCGRIADTGRDPVPHITQACRVKHAETQILWASTREVLNVKQAQSAGADIITMTPDLIRKMALFGKDLAEYSRETVAMFYNDGKRITL